MSCENEGRLSNADAGWESLTRAVPKEVDYLKKVRKYQNANLIMGAVISFFFGMCLPPAMLVLSFIDRGIQDYQLARLKVAWHIGLLKMFIWGAAACVLYLLCMLVIRMVIRRKRRR